MEKHPVEKLKEEFADVEDPRASVIPTLAGYASAWALAVDFCCHKVGVLLSNCMRTSINSCYTFSNMTQLDSAKQVYPLQIPDLDEVARRIRQVSDPTQIVVFGSHARGEISDDSDLDLLVVMENIESTRAESIRIRRVLRNLMYPIDIIVATPQQLARHRNTLGMIYQTILNEGRVIYERTTAG